MPRPSSLPQCTASGTTHKDAIVDKDTSYTAYSDLEGETEDEVNFV